MNLIKNNFINLFKKSSKHTESIINYYKNNNLSIHTLKTIVKHYFKDENTILLQFFIDEIKEPEFFSYLYETYSKKNFKINFESLITNNIPVHPFLKYDNSNPMVQAISNNNLDIINLIFKYKIPYNKNFLNNYISYYSITHNNTNTVETLINNGIFPSQAELFLNKIIKIDNINLFIKISKKNEDLKYLNNLYFQTSLFHKAVDITTYLFEKHPQENHMFLQIMNEYITNNEDSIDNNEDYSFYKFIIELLLKNNHSKIDLFLNELSENSNSYLYNTILKYKLSKLINNPKVKTNKI